MGIKEINLAMNQLNKNSQDKSQISEEISVTLRAIRKQSEDLGSMVIDLQTIVADRY